MAANPEAPAPITITSGSEAREIFGKFINAETDKMDEINCLRLKKLNFLYRMGTEFGPTGLFTKEPMEWNSSALQF